MIESLRIRSLGVIDEAELPLGAPHSAADIQDASLPLGPGYTVVTGETGAGKTMVVTALGLLTGRRADAGIVRRGQDKAVVEATIIDSPDAPAFREAAEAGAELDDDGPGRAALYLSRTVSAEGRGRAHAGGRSIPVGALGRIGDKLVAVHGQSDQLRLRGTGEQRAALDAFGGEDVAAALAKYVASFEALNAATAELADIHERGRERALEAETLQSALEEIDRVDPQPGEDDELTARSLRLTHVEELRGGAASAHAALVSEEIGEAVDAVSLVDAAKRALEAVDADDPALAEQTARLRELGYILSDVATELASYMQSLDADAPAELAAVEDRRADLAGLQRRYAPSIDEVLEWAAQARVRLSGLQDDPARAEELTAAVARLQAELEEHSQALHALRVEAAQRLSTRVDQELHALAMPQARLSIQVEAAAPATHGADEINFLLAPHPGSDPRPLGKGASGGELSRVMLALEVVLAEVDPVPTFVFDEVDSGVGGEAAVEIGRRLARLARHVQVVVVTHLPQVAAFADRHLNVTKTAHGEGSSGFTTSDVVTLDTEGRITELARMLAGQADSEAARAHAKELLEDAAAEAARPS
ncbi:DNA repair protein RecN [Galactobacter caseinivorans]|uniref:DNA repair protein RecN n=1 Tax=Galactobacter caseinivorans TaxID=2676123 RepID=A0A496PKI3_9MICC|nr:DNA repair protein RecN [Galactobacter caseinivorans]RKW70925.1 DNA repair protein RecN [Galactobacter caseinivorans]